MSGSVDESTRVTSDGVRRFFFELKRRKVYRAAAVYVVVGLGVLGAAEVILDPLGLGGARPLIVVATLLGFPIAVVLAWAYELRPEEPLSSTVSTAPTHGIAAVAKGRPS